MGWKGMSVGCVGYACDKYVCVYVCACICAFVLGDVHEQVLCGGGGGGGTKMYPKSMDQ